MIQSTQFGFPGIGIAVFIKENKPVWAVWPGNPKNVRLRRTPEKYIRFAKIKLVSGIPPHPPSLAKGRGDPS